jgi:putative nucleotidyltransferase with HDIG domain
MLRLPTDVLQPGMVLAKPITDERGSILLRQGIPLTGEYIINIKRRGFSSVYISDGDTDDIVIEDMLPDEVRRNAQATLARVFDFSQRISADFDKANSDAVVAAMGDSSVVNALRANKEFKQLEESVTSVLNELIGSEMLTGISQIRSHNDVNFSHAIDVTVTALMLGKRLHLNQEDLKRLGAGCMLHDIGKIFIDPVAFGPQEDQPGVAARHRSMREHARLGYELLRTRNPDNVMANHVALEHHERQDGQGYPRGMRGTNTIDRARFDRKNILLIAEIAAIADVYDILSIDKPERPALTPKQIADTMRRLGGTFLNQELVQHFLSMLPILPAGIGVVVRTGRYREYKGVVVQANKEQPDRPVIRLLYNPKGDRVVPVDLNLANQETVVVEATLR